MQEIKCPKCGEVFQVDESGYAAIVRQVRDSEFQKELEQRAADAAQLEPQLGKLIHSHPSFAPIVLLNHKIVNGQAIFDSLRNRIVLRGSNYVF